MMIRGVLLFFLLFSLIGPSSSQELKYCIQVAADKDFLRIKQYYEMVKELPYSRIEQRDSVFLLRVGAEDQKKNLVEIHKKIRRYFKDSYIKKCEISEEHVVYPRAEGKQIEPTKVHEQEKPAGTDPEIKSLKEDVSYIKKRVEELSSLNKNLEGLDVFFRIANPKTLEKFLISIGILIGGLFLFTWILIIWIYRRVSISRSEETKLNRIITLLKSGKAVRLEDGKLLIYDEETEDWKEAE